MSLRKKIEEIVQDYANEGEGLEDLQKTAGAILEAVREMIGENEAPKECNERCEKKNFEGYLCYHEIRDVLRSEFLKRLEET